MKPIENKEIIIAASEELISTINSIHGVLILAQYHKNRTEINAYLGLISTCITKVEEIVKVYCAEAEVIKHQIN